MHHFMKVMIPVAPLHDCSTMFGDYRSISPIGIQDTKERKNPFQDDSTLVHCTFRLEALLLAFQGTMYRSWVPIHSCCPQTYEKQKVDLSKVTSTYINIPI